MGAGVSGEWLGDGPLQYSLGNILSFYKEKLPLANKKVVSQAVGLDGEALPYLRRHTGLFGHVCGQPRAS